MSTAITPVNTAVKYFSDSHCVPSMDSAEAKVQKLDSEIAANISRSIGPRKLVSDALRSRLADGEAEKLADELVSIATEAGKASDRLAAIAEITDRTEGKAMQNIRHAGVFIVAAPGAEALAALDAWSSEEE